MSNKLRNDQNIRRSNDS